MRLPVLIVLAILFDMGAAHARNNEVQRGPAPDWVIPSELLPVPEDAAGLVFVRRQDTLVHLDEQGQAEYIGYRMKILHSTALQLGNLSIAWNPDSGAPVVHGIKIYREGEVIDVLGKATFEILRREGQLEQASLDGILTAVLQISDLRVGDELEVNLTTRTNDPVLGNNDAGYLLLLPNRAPGRFRMGLSWIEGQEPNIQMSAEMETVAQRQMRSVDLRFDNQPVKLAAKDAPGRYLWKDAVEFSDFSEWAAISRYFTPLFVKAATLSEKSPVKREAARIAAAHESEFDRASAALKLVQQDVRYIYVGLNGGNFRPATAEETWQRRYGDCKGKTALLMSLLAELGIKAEVVLVNNSGADDGFNERLPSPKLFDHVLVRGWINGKAYWMDGTLPAVVPPSADPFSPYRWVLPLAEQGHVIEQVKWKPLKRPNEISLYELDARDGFDKPARIISTKIVRGIGGVEQQIQLSAVAPGDLLSAFRQQLVGDYWLTVDDVQWRYDQSAGASILTIIGTSMPDWDDDGDGAMSLSLPGGGFNPPSKRARPDGEDDDVPYFNAPEYSCYATTVKLPLNTKVDNWSYKSGYDMRIFGKNYYRAFDLRDGAVRMVRGFRVEQQEIDAASALVDNERISDFDNSMGWIFYDPADEDGPDLSGGDVPATYDIDWLADDVPCLAPRTVR